MLGLYGVRGIDHVGMTVPDLDDALDFWTGVLGATLVLRHGPYPRSITTPEQFGRPADSSVVGIAMISLGRANIELLEFDSPGAPTVAPSPDAVGAHHIAVYVDDIDGAVAEARAAGVEVLGQPMALPGPEAGERARFVFLRAPWGVIIELVSYPHGKAYQSDRPDALADLRRDPRV